MLQRIARSTLLALLAAATTAQDAPPVPSGFATDAPRQFDFWVGEWDVNLRMLQDDLTWKDSVRAHAEIHSILGGRAILELWDSAPILGYSLRYHDAATGKWVLWLNWPGNNRAGSSSLTGEFRHGRGEFFSSSTDAQGNESISRYTFSDATPTSLRWDDAYSSDGGKTWSASWIMEFTRTRERPDPPTGGKEHTYQDGGRCDRDEFRRYEFLAGDWTGTSTRGDGPDGTATPARGTGSLVLGGCALIAFRAAGELQAFSHLTYNTHAELFELTFLDDQGGPARLYYGNATDDGFDLTHSPSPGAAPTHRYVLTHPDADGAVVERFLEADGAGGWNETARWQLTQE